MTLPLHQLRIFIIEDEPLMAECLARALDQVTSSAPEILRFSNAIEAMSALAQGLPDLIMLDVLLDGPDGFTFLNELMSYTDTARIPVIIVTSLDLGPEPLADYGVVAVLQKDTMTPATILQGAQHALGLPTGAAHA